MQEILPSYDQIYLRPEYSTLPHRSEADTSVHFLGRKFSLPVIPANMEDVIGFDNARWLSNNNYFYIMHRFKGATLPFVEYAIKEKLPYISISVGVDEDSFGVIDKIFHDVGIERIDFITIDVAHAHHEKVEKMIKDIRSHFDTEYPKIIAGNVATLEGYEYLVELGVDAVKCGLAGGGICTTKFETGFHIPTAASLIECKKSAYNVPIIADGGVKHHGDIAKALCLSATMTMCGALFASCLDSPAKIVHGKKIYRGSTSYAAKGHDTHVEGKTIELEGEITYEKRMERIRQALCSSISYAGGNDLSAFKKVEWGMVL